MRAAIVLLAAVLAWSADAASIKRSVFGTTATGARVELVTLHNDRGMLLEISTRGGAIVRLDAPDRGGRMADVVLGHTGFAGWETAGAFNTIVGRYANRIAGGFTLDGQHYALAGTDPATGVVLHGGPNAFSSRIWQATTFRHGSDVGVRLTLVSPDGDNGYPGTVRVTVSYTLTPEDVVRVDYAATTDRTTVINLTNHTYFALGGSGAGPIYDQRLQVFASRYTPTDARQIPTGVLAPVAGTPFDFRTAVPLRDRLWASDPQMLIGRGLDHNFVLDRPEGGGFAHAVRLADPASGRVLDVWTTEPGVQVYSGNRLDGRQVGADGRTLRQSDGIAFETQHYPDSPNQPSFPSTVLRSGETFRSITEWRFTIEDPRL